MFAQIALDAVVEAQFAHHRVERLSRAQRGVVARVMMRGRQVQREEVAEHLGGDAHRHRQRLRLVVMAGDQAPELAADDDRDRHRRRDAHVAQIFEMHRRDAAQMGEGEVERGAGGVEFRRDEAARPAGVGDDADRVLQIEHARLLRNVGGGEMLAEETFEMRALGLADHFAGAVLGEAVDHHPVVFEHRLQKARRLPRHLLDGCERLGAGDQHAGEVERVASQRGCAFEFEDRVAVVAMRGDIELRPALGQRMSEHQTRPPRFASLSQRVAHDVDGLAGEIVGELGADGVAWPEA